MKRLVYAVFWAAQIPAGLAIAAGMLLQNAGGWVLEKEQERRR